MRPKVLFSALLTTVFVLASGCGSVKNCPVCGTTTNDGYANIDVIPVPEHNPTGEPGGPFNSFDISWLDPVRHLDYVSDRIGLDVAVIDTQKDVAVAIFTGANGVAGAGDLASPCLKDASGNDIIPPLVSALGNWTRFGCRTTVPGQPVPFHIPGFGSNSLFGGFPGAQCCAARANGVNPLSGPDGELVTPDGKTLFTSNGSSSIVVFDLTSMDLTTSPPTPPNVIAIIPTGLSPDFDGQFGNNNPSGIAPCVASANGRAFSDPTCGDLRVDESSYDPKDQILAVANGDPGFPFVTFIDMSGINARTSHCLPFTPNLPYGPPFGAPVGSLPINSPTCIIGQIYYDGAPQNNSNVAVDDIGLNGAQGFICPDPSNPQVQSGASGHPGYVTSPTDVPCHHGPIVTASGQFCNQTAPAAGCAGAISPAGLGGSAFNPNTGHFLLTNANATTDLTVGTVDEIDPRPGNPNGPVVINTFVMPSCMPTSIVQGPGNNFLVGCADHDGEAFPPNMYVIDGTSGAIKATINTVGGVDEIWYNPGDNRYYLAARDMPGGPVLGVIDAKTNLWLQNVPTNANSHSVAVDPSNNHAFVPLQAGAPCRTQSANGCIGVYAQQ